MTGRCSGSRGVRERGGDGTVERRGASVATGSGAFPGSASPCKKQLQLLRIKLLALHAKEPSRQRIDLLAQERILLFQDRDPRPQRGLMGRSRVRHAAITL